MSTPKVILLRGDPIYGEARATAAITPGMAIATLGGARTVSNDPTCAPAAAGAVAPIFARENDIIGDGIDDVYAINENVLFHHARRGDWIYALLATGANVAAGAALSIGAGGLLVAATPASTDGTPEVTEVTFPSPIIARALEAVNNAAGASPVRIKVEIV